MKKALIYSLSLALLLSLTACNRAQTEQQDAGQPDPAAASTPADVSTREPVKDAPDAEPPVTLALEPVEDAAPEPETPEASAPEPPADPAPVVEPEPEQPPETPVKKETPKPAEETPAPAPAEPEEAQPAEESQEQSTGSTQKIDGHDDLGDYVLNGKGGKYYPALGVTLPVSYNGKTHEGIDFSESEEYKEAMERTFKHANESSEFHTNSWKGVTMG